MPPPRKAPKELYNNEYGLTNDDKREIKQMEAIVKEFEKALKKPAFMARKIKERDLPIHKRWCSVKEEKNVDCFLNTFIEKNREENPDVSPYDMLDEIRIVHPTVQTIDLFQMINLRKSYRGDDLQWSGYAELYSKIWSELDVHKFFMLVTTGTFVSNFDDMDGIMSMLNGINDIHTKVESEMIATDAFNREEFNTVFVKEASVLKEAYFSSWFKRVETSVGGAGDLKTIQRMMWVMMEFKLAFGFIPYEKIPIKDKRSEKSWMSILRRVPDPFNIVILYNKRDSAYSCWDFKTNTQISLLFDKFGGMPFDTKLSQLMKSEYVYADLFKKQTGTHLSNGYILAEEKVDPSDTEIGTDGELSTDERRKAQEFRDKADDTGWKQQLGDYDNRVKYAADGVYHPQRVIMRGIERAPRIPPMSRFANPNYGNSGGKVKGGVRKGRDNPYGKLSDRDPASELVRSLQKDVNSGQGTINTIQRELKSLMSDEDRHMKVAAKNLEELLSNRNKIVSKVHRNMELVSKNISEVAQGNEKASLGTKGCFGLIPLRRIISTMDSSMVSIYDMVQKLETAMKKVGVDPDEGSSSRH